MPLAIDIGNTRTQLRIYDHRSTGQSSLQSAGLRCEVETSELAGDCPAWPEIEIWWQSLSPQDRPDTAVLLSVVPGVAEVLACRLEGRLSLRTHTISIDDPFALDIAYATPRTLGLDRLVAASAAFHRHAEGQGVVVVDCGTATTVDVVTSRSRYLGGAIAPGLGTAAHALIAKGAQLPEHRLELPPRAIGDSTELSLRSGVMLGHAVLVEGLVARMREDVGEPCRVVVTGGWARALAPALRGVDRFDPDLLTWGACALLARVET